MSLSVRSTASNANLLAIGASSHIINEQAVSRPASCDCCRMEHVVPSNNSIGMSNLLWAVRPPGKSSDAIPSIFINC
ncbi:unnamed protein product [Cuscuta campestris]|uniref:Uncharacterized protein n=1 Tax=Cuscuta campestris TaxID=132261 RepID=A0A484LEB5_9ASTE|nr:unnamed protein product [Cuscuta campestris]